MVDEAGPDFSLATPGQIPLVLSNREVKYLTAYLLNELNEPDSDFIDSIAQKLNDYLLHIAQP